MVLILRLVLLFYFKLLFLLFKGSFIGKKNAEIIENEIAINFLLYKIRLFAVQVKKSINML